MSSEHEDCDWKKYDTQDHEADAAYFDQLAQDQAATPAPAKIEFTPNYLKLAQRHMDDYERRINQDNFYGSLEDRLRYEDAAYKQAILNMSYAQAEAATRQAQALESLCEFAGELIGATDLTDALMQWSYRQRAG